MAMTLTTFIDVVAAEMAAEDFGHREATLEGQLVELAWYKGSATTVTLTAAVDGICKEATIELGAAAAELTATLGSLAEASRLAA
jgi:hypothetical protein